MSEPCVLDASAVLAFLLSEPGSDLIERHLDQAIISAVNHSEVLAKLIEKGMDADAAVSAIDALGLDCIAFDATTSALAARLRPATRAAGLSLGDRACLALAQATQRPVITTDKIWAKLKVGVKITLAR